LNILKNITNQDKKLIRIYLWIQFSVNIRKGNQIGQQQIEQKNLLIIMQTI
jgi:hypothetical protein